MTTMRVLITGGLGVNGAWVTRELVDRGIETVVIDNREDFSLLGARYVERIVFEKVDIRIRDHILDVLERHKISAVVHMAAAVGHQDIDPNPAGTFEINALATINLLEAARCVGVNRFIFASSRAVYGSLNGCFGPPTYRPVDETNATHHEATYDLCKIIGERFGEAFAAISDMEFAALRFSTIFGPGKTTRHGRFGALSKLIENPFYGEPVTIPVGGDQVDDMIYAQEAARGVVAALLAPTLPNSIYNIATGRGYTLHDVARAVRQYYPNAEISIGDGLNYLGSSVNYSGILSPERAQHDLGFSANTDLSSAIGKYYEALS
jgi:UDP-glucose 4-epimerase